MKEWEGRGGGNPYSPMPSPSPIYGGLSKSEGTRAYGPNAYEHEKRFICKCYVQWLIHLSEVSLQLTVWSW